jgi:hypothetical protein
MKNRDKIWTQGFIKCAKERISYTQCGLPFYKMGYLFIIPPPDATPDTE